MRLFSVIEDAVKLDDLLYDDDIQLGLLYVCCCPLQMMVVSQAGT